MARGRRSGRTGASGDPTRADGSATPKNVETVEYEELPEGPSPEARGPAGNAGAGADTERTDVMAQPDDVREAEAALVAEPPPSPAPPPRRGGLWPGLIGGLLGGAAVAGGSGWYMYERGPIKPALERLATTEASTRDAENGIAALGGKLDALGTDVGGKLNELGTSLGGLGDDLRTTKAALQQADSAAAALDQRIAGAESAISELGTKLDQADRTFRAASEEVIARLEAVNAKLVEVEQAQPADIVDKKTVSDIAAKQASVDEGQQSIAAGLARLEQLVTQSLEAGNQQGEALRVVVDGTRSRLDEVLAQQRDLLALKDQLARQEQADQQQVAALAETGNQVTTVRSDLEQRLSDVTSRLTALDAARERGVGLSVAVHDLASSLETGEPFTSTVQMLVQLGQDDPVVTDAVAKVEPLADKGIPTIAGLAEQLGAVEQSLAPVTTAPSDDWLARTRENLQGLVNLHPLDAEDVPGQGAVEGARQALFAQDLPGAMSALKPLADQGNAPAQAWVASAEQRLEAAAAVDTLREHVKTMLTRQG